MLSIAFDVHVFDDDHSYATLQVKSCCPSGTGQFGTVLTQISCGWPFPPHGFLAPNKSLNTEHRLQKWTPKRSLFFGPQHEAAVFKYQKRNQITAAPALKFRTLHVPGFSCYSGPPTGSSAPLSPTRTTQVFCTSHKRGGGDYTSDIFPGLILI